MDLKALVVSALAQRKTTALLIGGAGVAFLGFGLGYKYLRKPEKLVRVGVVSQLLIHPLKSGRAASVALAECQKFGLKFGELQDRWVCPAEDFNVCHSQRVTEKHTMVTKKTYSQTTFHLIFFFFFPACWVQLLLHYSSQCTLDYVTLALKKQHIIIDCRAVWTCKEVWFEKKKCIKIHVGVRNQKYNIKKM